jgi:hypothetical protein
MSTSTNSSWTRKTRRSRLVALSCTGLLALAAVGCTNPSNTPEAYGETNADGVDIVRANFLEGCVAAGDEAGIGNSSDCECQYDAIVEEIPFEEFQEIEDQLKDDPTDLPDRYIDIADRCVDGEVTVPRDDDTTTTAG